MWQDKYRSASSVEALEASLLEDFSKKDVDRIIHWEENDCIQRLFTSTSEWKRMETFRRGLPSSYDPHVGELQPFDGYSPNPTMTRFRFHANFAPLLTGRLLALNGEGDVTICWEMIRNLSQGVLHKGYDFHSGVADIFFMNSAVVTNLCPIAAVFDLLSNSSTTSMYNYIQRGTVDDMSRLEVQMPTLLTGLISTVIFGNNPYATFQEMKTKHPELQNEGMYPQLEKFAHMTMLACGWATIDEVMSIVNELSLIFSTLLGLPYYEFNEEETKDIYNRDFTLAKISKEKVRTLIETTIRELEVLEPEVALRLQCIAQSAFAEQAISNMSRNQAICFKRALQHAIDHNMTHTIAERQCNICNRQKICAYSSTCLVARDNNRRCYGRCQDQVIREAEEPFNILYTQSELMFGMCSEANCGYVGLLRQKCSQQRHGYCNNPISLLELQSRTPRLAGTVTNNATQYCMTEVPCVMVDNNNVQIDEQVFYKAVDAAKRVLEIKANPTVLDLGGLLSIPQVLNINIKYVLRDRISILLWNNGSYDGEIDFGNFRLKGLGVGQHRDPNQWTLGCFHSRSGDLGPPADIIARYQEWNVEDEMEDESEEVEQWVQCSTCGKWRKLPASIPADSLPDKWYCVNNTWDTQFATCDAIEESDD